MPKQLLIIGAGGHGKVVADAAMRQGNWEKIVFLDDRFPHLTSVMGIEVIAQINDCEQFSDSNTQVIVAIGNAQVREKIQEQLSHRGISIATVCHPSAIVAQSAQIKAGTVIFAAAVINPDVKIGRGVIVNTGAIVEHDCEIGDWTHLCPKVACAGNVKIGSQVWVGMGANIIQNVAVGNLAVIGAGAVVVREVTNHQRVVGVPAREMVHA